MLRTNLIPTAYRKIEHRLTRMLAARKASRLSDPDYLEMYRQDSDRRAAVDPREAIGGLWQEVGTLQFEFLKGEGLQPDHTLLDIGCGSLRAGLHFIRYLDATHYTGFDISQKLLSAGRAYVAEEGLADKAPVLLHNDGPLDFSLVAGRRFDFLLAQSVFTHLRPSHIEECFANLPKVMHADSAFYLTFIEGDRLVATARETFRQPFSFYEVLARQNGLALRRHPDYEVRHPRKQKMLSVQLLPSTASAP